MGWALGNRYQVDDPIGQGPHGSVSAGTDDAGNRLAFKTLRNELGGDPDLVARYLQVEGPLRETEHPNLVRVRELVAADGTTTIVTDLVTGSDLRRLISANGPLLPAEIARLGAAVAAGLAQLHRSGVVHGDVKPANIVLDESASTKVPRITDAVLARIIGLPDGAHGTPSLTDVRYAAPELAEGGTAATPATDLYALGIILYEMCCGVPPFVGATPYLVVRQHVEYEPGRPDGVPDPLWHVIWLLLLKSPRERLQSANEVAVVLEHMVPELMSASCALRLATPPQGARLDQRSPQPEPNHDPPTVVSPPPAFDIPSGGAVPTKRKRRRVLTATALTVVVLTGLLVCLTTWSGGTAPAAAPGPPPVVATATTAATQPTIIQTQASAEPTVAPNLIGKSIDVAQDSLPSSIKVETTDAVDTTHPGGTVIAQDPAAGQPLNGTIQLTVAEAPEIIYLDSLPPANGGWSQADANASLGGQTFVHSVIDGFTECNNSGATQIVEYNLSKGYSKFVTTAGIDDQSQDSNAEVNLQIFGDNQQLSNIDVNFGKPVPLSIDVSGVLRLKIEFQPIGSTEECDNDNLDLGTAELQGLPGEVPASVDPNSSVEPEPTN